MSIHKTTYKDAPSNGSEYVRKDGAWAVSTGGGGGGYWTASGNDIYNSNTGNVGIGTTVPLDKLDVSSGNNLDSGDIGIILGGTSANSRQAHIYKRTSLSPDRALVIQSSKSTTSSEILFMRSSAAEAMRIDSAGRVGIGVTSPLHALHIIDGSPTTPVTASATRKIVVESDTSCGIRLNANGADYWSGIEFSHNNANVAGMFYYGPASTYEPSTYQFNANNYLWMDETWATEYMRLTSAGELGIGTDTPSERLTVQADSTSADVPVVLLEAPGGNGGRIVMDSDIQAGNWQINWDTGAVEQFMITQSGSGAAEFYIYPMVAGAGGTIGLNTDTIYAQGKVGINETSPTYQLSVKASQGQYNPSVALYGDDVASGWARLNLYPRNSGNTGYDTAGYLAASGASTWLRAGSNAGDDLRLHADDSGGSVVTSVGGTARSTVFATKVQNTVPLLMAEASAATTDVAGYGQFWVKDDTPNVPMFTNDAGTDSQIPTYSVGTFTPVIWDNTMSSSEGQTYTTQKGYYWRIGDLVHIWLELTVSSFGTLTTTEQARIGGLPFTASNDSNQGAKGLHCVYFSSLSLPVNENHPTGRIPNNVSYILMERQGGNIANAQALLLSHFTSDGSVVMQGFYEAA